MSNRKRILQRDNYLICVIISCISYFVFRDSESGLADGSSRTHGICSLVVVGVLKSHLCSNQPDSGFFHSSRDNASPLTLSTSTIVDNVL